MAVGKVGSWDAGSEEAGKRGGGEAGKLRKKVIYSFIL